MGEDGRSATWCFHAHAAHVARRGLARPKDLRHHRVWGLNGSIHHFVGILCQLLHNQCELWFRWEVPMIFSQRSLRRPIGSIVKRSCRGEAFCRIDERDSSLLPHTRQRSALSQGALGTRPLHPGEDQPPSPPFPSLPPKPTHSLYVLPFDVVRRIAEQRTLVHWQPTIQPQTSNVADSIRSDFLE